MSTADQEDIGYGKNDPSVGHMRQVVDHLKFETLKTASMGVGRVTLEANDLIMLLNWVETLDHLHTLDHNLADEWSRQLAEIDELLFKSSNRGHSFEEKMRRLRVLVSQEGGK